MYSVYSSDPGADKAFKDFKEDNDNNHLRLLYCIDALNEGIHVDDINGVILLRPTVSPIVYKQQIGRALSASKKTNAVIFDIVLNIENLYSIDSVKEEMEVATSYYRSLGESEEIINEKFKVVDEVRNCRELFEKLNDTLTATWDMYYACAKDYYKDNGNLQVSARYITEESYALGSLI
ncbi:helicase-related protein, partial [Catenibacterium sp.]|uniref:helicase-related protein n=1 Tax=Catenibacterium sp. TaxID=2049022 RepID=UPI003FD71315